MSGLKHQHDYPHLMSKDNASERSRKGIEARRNNLLIVRSINRKDYFKVIKYRKEHNHLIKQARQAKALRLDNEKLKDIIMSKAYQALELLLQRYITRIEDGENLRQEELLHMESLANKLLPYQQPRIKAKDLDEAIPDTTQAELDDMTSKLEDLFKEEGV